jgi:hypothetical protein
MLTTATMVPGNAHKDIPGNPSTAVNTVRLRDHADASSLRVLSPSDWAFWKENGYVVIKQAVPRALGV